MREFLKQTFASLLGSLTSLIVFFSLGAGGLIFLLIAVAARDTGPQVKDQSVLVFDLSLNITDTEPTLGTNEAISRALSNEDDTSITLRTVLDTLDKATKDQRIVALYLNGSQNNAASTTGFATLKEVRQALARFQAAGKQIITYDVNLGEKEYYLSSIADKIFLNPIGAMEIDGFSSEQQFLKGALEKFGIGVQVLRVGKYKSAVEPFLLEKLSPESEEQSRALLWALWGEFLSAVGKSREITPQQLQGIADAQGILLAEEALQRGLVDQVAYFDEVLAELKRLTGKSDQDTSFPQINLTTYAEVDSPDSTISYSENKIALVYAEGSIVSGQGGFQQVGSESFSKRLRKLRQDQDVKAVVLRVNSPGGSATASEIIQREVVLTREQKPVIVSMGDVAASGGYWIATYGDRIFAEPTTITGSIGVFGLLLNIQQIANDNGITWDVVKTSRFADSQTITRPKTEQELAIYQKSVDQIYDQFLDKVAESRKMPRQKVEEIAQGRVWSGVDAKKLGLVDEIGGIEQAIEYAAKEANLGKNWQIQEYQNTPSLEEQILKKLTSEAQAQNPQLPASLTAEFLKLQKELEMLTDLDDPRSVYARLPFNWQID
ncbi:MAG: signal peptide peptidase SppA [Symploca sp. SIO2E6]|nr:signal peptide peptidase SppA [Symploca sp. SIO2E6]